MDAAAASVSRFQYCHSLAGASELAGGYQARGSGPYDDDLFRPLLDVRLAVFVEEDADELVANILNLKSRTEGVDVKVTGELNRPPYETSNAGAALYEHARLLAADIGFELSDTFTGGGSDGNFTAPHTATLDGLGVDGKGAHTHYEQIYISSLEPRARLLHRLYQTLR